MAIINRNSRPGVPIFFTSFIRDILTERQFFIYSIHFKAEDFMAKLIFENSGEEQVLADGSELAQ